MLLLPNKILNNNRLSICFYCERFPLWKFTYCEGGARLI
jgi:hypothetical protein